MQARRASVCGSRPFGPALWVAIVALLAGCASGPARPPAPAERDGADANPPADLAAVPDAEPKLEPIRAGGPNKPYDQFGKSYVPITQDTPFTERGLASWYGRKFQGRRTASGEAYNMYAMTAAHPTLPLPSYARIRNPANGREVVVRINDRGPFHAGRIVDLSYTAAFKLDLLRNVAPVELQRITFDEIRSGAWRRGTEGHAPRLASGVPAASGAAAPLPPGAGASTGTPMPTPVSVALPAESAEVASEPRSGTNADAAVAVATPTTPPPAIEPIADAPPARAFTAAARGFWVQLGAFRLRTGAESFRARAAAELDWLAPLLAVFDDAAMFRLQAGPYPSRDEARGVAERVRGGLQLVPVIIERR